MPVPAKGFYVKHVAIGRGTQNYTCSNETTSPTATGAVATLFDATCLSSTQPEILNSLSALAISYAPSPLPFSSAPSNSGFGDGPIPNLGPSALAVSGVHYFDAEGVPFFDLERAGAGSVAVEKAAGCAAPGDAGVGLKGEPAVSWLQLVKVEGSDGSGGLEDVYRVGTVGGSPPKTCEGMPQSFEVEYAAQ
ncbi:DUF3455 domain-containing protein [Candidatus Bathyarchaeota archaeon]|nr:DUF3455 domain-containing protein [Candidatus Bathyarchaeota archaeon]